MCFCINILCTFVRKLRYNFIMKKKCLFLFFFFYIVLCEIMFKDISLAMEKDNNLEAFSLGCFRYEFRISNFRYWILDLTRRDQFV